MFGMRSFLVVFIVVLGLWYATAKCPPESLITPCTCTGNMLPVVECKNITEMQTLVDVFNRTADRKFNNFQLINSSVMYLPADAISSKGFEELALFNVTMSSLFNALPTNQNAIFKIIMKDVRFQRAVGWELFEPLKQLVYFEVTRTEIKSIDKNFAEKINRGMMYFLLSKTKTRKVHQNAFAALPKLLKLQIADSEIKSLQRSMFPNSTELGEIDFSGNKISTLPDDLFSNMPNLTIVQINRNKLTTITEAVFRSVHDRSGWIYLYGNPIVCDCKIRWLVNAGKGQTIGKCDSPADMKGKWTYDLKKSDLDYC